ncbi:reelin domain-containing protein 1-like [Carassius carassius]|uniref:reelin domain-containing protein 1-like n=1 Tax=Carassius carassius TaxID=217509 RepID=UPI002868FE4C|nr:reelin domain-containing protein 1-like [Carassius carassius]
MFLAEMMMMMKKKMMLMKAVWAACVFLCVFPARGVCFSRGASVSSCVNMKPGHISSFPQHTHTHPTVSVRTSRSVYLPQHTLTVTVQSSRAFMGFLLQARSVVEDRVVGGEFTLHPPSTHTLSCLSPDDTVTHSDKMLKRNLSFSWRAPTHPSGDLRFYITLVQSYFVYWSRIKSAVVHDGTRSSQNTDSVTGQPMASRTDTNTQSLKAHTNTQSTHNTYTTPTFNTHTNTQSLNASHNLHINTHSTHNTNTHSTPNTQTPSFNTQTITQSSNATKTPLSSSTQTSPNTSSSQSISTLNTPTPNNTHQTSANNTHTVPNPLLQTHASLQMTMQHTHTYTPPSHTHSTQSFDASLHPKPSPALRQADFFSSREPTERAISLTQHKKHPFDLFGDVLSRPKQAKAPSGVPERGMKRPEHVPRQSAPELGLLLGLSAALGMAIAVGLRYLQRKHCRKRTAVSLNDRSHDDRGIMHVQECGDLVQVRKIRQNSVLVLQAEYNLITPSGN